MGILEALIIGLIQGLTEFLPISSSGHMILAGKILDVEVTLGYELFMHLATLLAVIIVMRREIFKLIKKPVQKQTGLILAATLPTVIIVFAFKNVFDLSFDGRFLPYCFLITAILLLLAGIKKGAAKKEISYADAMMIGVVQGIAAFPGISRSGSTISTSILLGNDKDNSARFSFLISVPIIIGSAAIEFAGHSLGDIRLLPMLAGFAAAFVSGYFALKLMLKKLAKSFDFFAIYLLALSIFLFLNNLILHWF